MCGWMADFRALELSLTVPITNSLAFLFTVLGEWWAEKKVITKGMFHDISLGLVLCSDLRWMLIRFNCRYVGWYGSRPGRYRPLRAFQEHLKDSNQAWHRIASFSSIYNEVAFFPSYTVIITLAFLYQLNKGFSPFLVCVSSTYAHLLKKSSCFITRVSFPVMAR